MSYLTARKYSQGREFNVVYNNFKGVDFSDTASNSSRERFAYLENMYRDYDTNGNIIQSIPGYRKIFDTHKKINGLYTYKNSAGEDMLVIHSAETLYILPISDVDTHERVKVVTGIEDSEGDFYYAKDSLYILDGKKIFMVSDSYSGEVGVAKDELYIPTTHINGEEYEQRNLLTRYFYEKYNLSSVDAMAYGTPSLKYIITDDERLECSVCGCSENEKTIYIPSRVKFGDTYYSVKSIEDYAFKDNTIIEECYIANGVFELGAGAFQGCSSLYLVIISDTVSKIGASCFMGCAALTDLHLGKGVKSVGASVIGNCTALKAITTVMDENGFGKIENVEHLSGPAKIYGFSENGICIGVEIHNPTVEIISISDGENELEFTAEKRDNVYTDAKIFIDDKNRFNGKTLILKGVLSSRKSDYKEKYHGFMSSCYKDSGAVSDVITKCKIAESFDGRVFLTGNPDYPGFCFFSSYDLSGENNPIYFGEMNYFKDGTGSFANTALLAAGDSLAVFKERDDGSGSIFYHVPETTKIDVMPRIYPTSYVHSGFLAKGQAISFFDDPVFVSSKGISALAKKNINLERSVATRSTNVNNRLLSEDLSKIKLAIWKGYLVVLAEDKIYLADSRSTFSRSSGDIEYEWFYLSGIGSYRNDNAVYKYSAAAHSGFYVHEKVDTPTELTVFSTKIDGDTVYYVNEDGKRYELYPTEEMSGGDFSPAAKIISIDDRLIFATDDGQVLMFNTDKKGVAPSHLSNLQGWDEEEYRASWSNEIHPYFYSFAGHAVRYALQTKRDDGSIPNLLKNTVKNSLSIKCKSMSSGKIICEVGTDKGGYKELSRFPSRDIFFADLDFSNFSMSTDSIYTILIQEKEKGWIEKQIAVYSEEFASPFAICNIAYRFSIKSKLKRNR